MIQPDNPGPQLFVLPDQCQPALEAVPLSQLITHLDSPVLVEMARDRLKKFQHAMGDLSLLLDEISRRNEQLD